MAYIEERVEKLTDAINDMRVEFSNRLTAIETEQRGTKDQLVKMNGSVARTIERTIALEGMATANEKEVCDVKEVAKRHENWISKTKIQTAFTHGKIIGVCAASSQETGGRVDLFPGGDTGIN